MTTRLGLGISAGEVRAVLARGGRVAWKQSRAVGPSDSLGDVITELIRSAPLRRFPRTPVIASIGPSLAQVKRLAGVSPSARGQVVSHLMRSNASRFFLRNGIPLAVTSAHRSSEGWWGAALEAPAVESVENACSNGVTFLEGCVPAITAIAAATRVTEADVDLVDGPVGAYLHISKGQWAESRREHRVSPGADTATAALAARHGLEPRFADALSAALSSPSSALFLRASRSRLTNEQRRTIRGAVSLLALVSTFGAVAAPGLAASRSAVHDAAKLETLHGTLTAWNPALAALRQTTAALNEIGAFAGERQSVALLLAAVSGALPDSTAIVSLRVDSAGGTMTVLSVTAASIVPRLSKAQSVVDPRIVGAVTREAVGGRQLQRVTIRFALRGLPRSTR